VDHTRRATEPMDTGRCRGGFSESNVTVEKVDRSGANVENTSDCGPTAVAANGVCLTTDRSTKEIRAVPATRVALPTTLAKPRGIPGIGVARGVVAPPPGQKAARSPAATNSETRTANPPLRRRSRRRASWKSASASMSVPDDAGGCKVVTMTLLLLSLWALSSRHSDRQITRSYS
jgi:hypothetical protein